MHDDATLPLLSAKLYGEDDGELRKEKMQNSGSADSSAEFRLGQRVHLVGDSRRVGTVKYVGPVEGHTGTWVGVDWDNGDAKHDGALNGRRYFEAHAPKSGSFVRPHVICGGISLFQALLLRYRSTTSKEEEGMPQ